jgi:hypothetical protein
MFVRPARRGPPVGRAISTTSAPRSPTSPDDGEACPEARLARSRSVDRRTWPSLLRRDRSRPEARSNLGTSSDMENRGSTRRCAGHRSGSEWRVFGCRLHLDQLPMRSVSGLREPLDDRAYRQVGACPPLVTSGSQAPSSRNALDPRSRVRAMAVARWVHFVTTPSRSVPPWSGWMKRAQETSIAEPNHARRLKSVDDNMASSPIACAHPRRMS